MLDTESSYSLEDILYAQSLVKTPVYLGATSLDYYKLVLIHQPSLGLRPDILAAGHEWGCNYSSDAVPIRSVGSADSCDFASHDGATSLKKRRTYAMRIPVRDGRSIVSQVILENRSLRRMEVGSGLEFRPEVDLDYTIVLAEKPFDITSSRALWLRDMGVCTKVVGEDDVRIVDGGQPSASHRNHQKVSFFAHHDWILPNGRPQGFPGAPATYKQVGGVCSATFESRAFESRVKAGHLKYIYLMITPGGDRSERSVPRRVRTLVYHD